MKANEYLDAQNIKYDLVEQNNPTKDCDDAARERGLETEQIVKSLIIERNREKGNKENSEKLHVLIPGNREVSERKFGEHRLLPPEQSFELTGFESGTVHPFSTNIPHIIDYRILEKEEVSFTIGSTVKGVILDVEEFQKAIDNANFTYDVEDIALHNEKDVENLVSKGLDKEKSRFILKNGLTPLYNELVQEYASEDIFKVLNELNRNEANYNKKQVIQILDEMKSETHMQKMVGEFCETGKIPKSDDSFNLDQSIENVLDRNSEAVQDLEQGKDSAINYLIGEVMKETKGQAKPDKTREKILKQVR